MFIKINRVKVTPVNVEQNQRNAAKCRKKRSSKSTHAALMERPGKETMPIRLTFGVLILHILNEYSCTNAANIDISHKRNTHDSIAFIEVYCVNN